MIRWDFADVGDDDLMQRRRELSEQLRTINSQLGALDHEIKKRGLNEQPGTGSLSKRQPWGPGWIQKSPKTIKLKYPKPGEEPFHVNRYWHYHWLENGKRKRKYIGTDEKLEKWKATHGANETTLEKWRTGTA